MLCWLEIAFQHLVESEEGHAQVEAAKEEKGEQLANALIRELSEGMQAMVAAAIAMDAFSDAVKQAIRFPKALTTTQRRNRTARYEQVAEVLRRGFRVGNVGTEQVRAKLKELYRFRDLAVHPPAEASDPIPYPPIESSVEWRFRAFCSENAKAATAVALSLIVQLIERPRDKHPELQRYCRSVSSNIKSVLTDWEARYGKLIGNQNTSSSGSSAGTIVPAGDES